MLRSYRTPKGTELPILKLKGREYLEVKYRLVWFREEHPNWGIETELLSVTQDSAYARATIKDDTGRIIATSHKFENRQGFPDFIEKAETGSIGRALALIGFGTQFCADELDEGQRIVDSPVVKNTPPSEDLPPDKYHHAESALDVAKDQGPREVDSPNFKLTFGKFKKYETLGRAVEAEGLPAVQEYVNWLDHMAEMDNKPLSENARFLKVAVGRYAALLAKRNDRWFPPLAKRKKGEEHEV